MNASPPNRRAVYLTGFMGSGKSTLGHLLADRLTRPFIDLDQVIVDRHGPIPELFATHGEPWFRQTEVDVLRQQPQDAVIALGGGAFMTQAVRDHISATGRAVFLDCPFPTLLARIQGDPNRPLAVDPEQLQALHARRLPVYRLADLVIPCPRDVSPPQLVEAMVQALTRAPT